MESLDFKMSRLVTEAPGEVLFPSVGKGGRPRVGPRPLTFRMASGTVTDVNRKRHSTKYPGIYYRESRPGGPRRYIVWYADANGSAHTETLPLGATLEDARLRQGQLKTRKSQGDRLVKTRMTVGELLDTWMDTRRPSLAPSTVETYEWSISVLKDHFGQRRVTELSASDIASMIAKENGKKAWTIKKLLSPLGGALKVAVREGWISSSPLEKLLPHERPKADQRKMRCLSREEISLLLDATSSTRWKAFFATLVFTGLRVGEALALRWEDVTEECIVVRAEEDGARKSAAARRQIMLIPALRRLLTAWKLQQGLGHQLVFTTASGASIGRRNALRALRVAEEKAGIPEYTLHELRHTFASILIGQGELPTFVAKQMGHADPSVTMSTYAHLWEEQESVEKARERLQEAFGGLV